MRLWFCNSYIQAANWWEEAFCTKFALSKLLCTPIEPIRARAAQLMAWQRKLRSGHSMCQCHLWQHHFWIRLNSNKEIGAVSKVAWQFDLWQVFKNHLFLCKRDYLVLNQFYCQRGLFKTFPPSKKRHICLASTYIRRKNVYLELAESSFLWKCQKQWKHVEVCVGFSSF